MTNGRGRAGNNNCHNATLWIFILRGVFALNFNEWETVAFKTQCVADGKVRAREGYAKVRLAEKLVCSATTTCPSVNLLTIRRRRRLPPARDILLFSAFPYWKAVAACAACVIIYMRTREINPHLLLSYASVCVFLSSYFLRQYQLYKYWKQNAFPAFHSS